MSVHTPEVSMVCSSLPVNVSRAKSSTRTSIFLAFAGMLAVVCMLTLGSLRSYGQMNTATLNGTVTDPSGAAVTGATVTVINTDTNVEHSTKTNAVGLYVVTSLTPGTYSVSVNKTGFAISKENSLTLQVAQVATVNIALTIGNEKQTVEVTTSTEFLDTTDASLGSVLPEQQVQDLPLNGRQFTQLLQLAPGTVPIDNSQNSGKAPAFGAGSASPGVNGQTNRSNIFFLDGIIASNPFFGGFSFSPSVDAIQEFKAQSHTDQAQFGQATGAIVSVVSRPGVNQIHGAAYEFVRNQMFDSKDTFDSVKMPYHQNQYGASFGGPILKNKLFYYANYEGGRQVIGASGFYSTVPTAAERTGDFTGTGLPQNIPKNPVTGVLGVPIAVKIYDPSTYGGGTCSTTAGVYSCTGTFTESQATGNKITPNAAMLAYMNGIYPAANSPLGSNGGAGQNNYHGQANNLNWNDQGTIRVDYTVGANDSVSGRYSQNSSWVSGPNGGVANLFVTGFYGKNMGGTWVHTFSPSLVAELTGGLNNLNIPQQIVTPEDQGALFTAVGFGAGFNEYPGAQGPPQPAMVPSLGLNGGGGQSTTYGGMWNGAGPIGPMHIAQGGLSLTKISGNHSLKFGASFYHTWMYTNWNGNNEAFSNQATWNAACQFVAGPGGTINAGPAAACPNYDPYPLVTAPTAIQQDQFGVAMTLDQAAGGDPAASMLLSAPISADRNLGNSGVNLLENTPEVYFQDSWKVSRRLTITYGIRWDYSSPMGEKDNRLATYDRYAQKYMVLQNDADMKPGLLSSLTAAQQANIGILQRNSIVTPHYLDFSPRLGFAYDIAPKTTLRAGLGRAFDDWGLPLQVGQQNRGAWPSGLDQKACAGCNLNFAGLSKKSDGTLVTGLNPFPAGPLPTGFNGISPLPGGGLGFQDMAWVPADSFQWNLELQRDFNKAGVLSVAYVGSHTTHQTLLQPYNLPAASATAYLNNSADPDQVMQGTAQTLRSTGGSNYHSLQAKITRAFANGLTYSAGFTWSKTLAFSSCNGDFSNVCIQNIYNMSKTSGDYGAADLHVPFVTTFNATYKLPFGKGEQFLNSGPVAYVVGNWQINTLFATRSGTPINPTYSNMANTGGGNTRINMNANPEGGAKHTRASWWNTNNTFQRPAVGTFGNAQINSLHGPHYWNDDLSIFRDIPVTEKIKGQFRFEAFDIFNHPNLGNPNNNPDSSQFNTITSTVGTTGPGAKRDLQFAFKVLF